MPIIGVSSETAFLTRPAASSAASSRDSTAKLDRQNKRPDKKSGFDAARYLSWYMCLGTLKDIIIHQLAGPSRKDLPSSVARRPKPDGLGHVINSSIRLQTSSIDTNQKYQ
jgi:hypothetical protein